MTGDIVVDCKTGHQRGCKSLCCKAHGDIGFGLRADGACAKLGEDDMCTIHDTRPQVCRGYHCNNWKELQKLIGPRPIRWFKEL